MSIRQLSILICTWAISTTSAQTGKFDIVSSAIAYKTIDTISLKLHRYLPVDFDSTKTYNSILFFHGGGWNERYHTRFKKQYAYFALRGLIAFSAEFRISNRNGSTSFESTEDAHDAFQYLVNHAEELHIDEHKIVEAGGSAGAQLAASTSFWNSADVLPVAQILFNPVLNTWPDGFANHRMNGKYMNYLLSII